MPPNKTPGRTLKKTTSRAQRREPVRIKVLFYDLSDPKKLNEAYLADFSPQGARLLSKHPIPPKIALGITGDTFIARGHPVWAKKSKKFHETGIQFDAFTPTGPATILQRKI